MILALLHWSRPELLAALVLPVLVLLLARVRNRPAPRATGTFALWQSVAQTTPQSARRTRHHLPPRVWWTALALALGAIALAGPRGRGRQPARTWRVQVDGSASTALAHRVTEAETDVEPATSSSRRSVAIQLASDALRAAWRDGDRVLWQAAGAVSWEGVQPAAPPDEWLRGLPRAPFEPTDADGYLWATDVAPESQPKYAGLVVSGGAAVAGPVAWEGRDWIQWNGEQLVRTPHGQRRCVLFEERAGWAPFAAFLELWCSERGLELAVTAPESCVALSVLGPGSDSDSAVAGRVVAAGRDGWSADFTCDPSAVHAERSDSSVWLRAPGLQDATPLVRSGRGWVELLCTKFGAPRGDSAAFALSWTDLLDGAVLAPPGVVPLAERSAAGNAQTVLGRPPPEEGARRQDRPLDAWTAFGAAAAGVVALGLGRRRPQLAQPR